MIGFGIQMTFFGGEAKANAKATAKSKAKAKAIDQSLRPSGFAPAFGRVSAALRLALDAGLKALLYIKSDEHSAKAEAGF